MIEEIRDKFNNNFSQTDYDNFINDIQQRTGGLLDFKICETPLFTDAVLTKKLIDASYDILSQLRTKEFLEHSKSAVPPDLNVPNENDHPTFLQIDFGIAKTDSGELIPQVIELQGFPSLYAYQAFLDQMLRKHFDIPNNLTTYFNNYDFQSFREKLCSVLLGNADHENVILLEIEPDKQKTRIDFHLTKEYCRIETVCLTDVIKKNNKLFYEKDGELIKIDRIYNRLIFDELIKKGIKYNFDFRDDLDVEWVGHPNWFFKISKHTLPFLKSEYAPDCYFLNEIEKYPEDLENYVLKPLYSFAGSGVIVDVKKEILDSIDSKENYILQRKVNYEPIIKTPDGYSKAEIRMMFLWDDEPILLNNLLRTSKGKMMGVDYNKNKTWIGSSIVYHP